MIIFKLQHRKTYHFADKFSRTTAISSSQKLLKIDSYTFITQLGDPALKHTRAIRHYSNYFPWEHLLSLQGELPLEAGGVAAEALFYHLAGKALSSLHHHTERDETLPWIPTPARI